jgi:hypothetical protein
MLCLGNKIALRSQNRPIWRQYVRFEVAGKNYWVNEK